MRGLPAAVKYTPGSMTCMRRGGQGLSKIPQWSLTGEDGTTIAVGREGAELLGFVRSETKTTARAFGAGRWCDGPLEPFGSFSLRPATAIECAVMNRVLRPNAVDADWPTLLAEASPCDHTDRFCAQNPKGIYA